MDRQFSAARPSVSEHSLGRVALLLMLRLANYYDSNIDISHFYTKLFVSPQKSDRTW